MKIMGKNRNRETPTKNCTKYILTSRLQKVNGGGQNKLNGHLKRYYRVYFLVFLVLSVITVYTFKSSYAIFKKEMIVKDFTIKVGELTYDIESTELSNGNITIPARTSKDITIKITSHNPINSKYELYYIVDDLTGVEVGYHTTTKDATKGLIETGESKTISLRIINNSKISKTITFGVEGGLDYNELELTKGTSIIKEIKPDYKDSTLNGCDPVLGYNLVPVTIANDGTVTMASTSDTWYDYANKKWANAVVLEDTAKAYNSGEQIAETDIESYFVWIPRYKYKIFNDGNYTGITSLNPDAPQTIEIQFEDKNTPLSKGTTVNSWLSHPAFQAFDANGFWVGKFELGYRGATATAEAEITTANATKLIIKPNTYSWRGMNVGNIFKTSYEYLRDSESHMMKNTEWGAVAYLSHSRYGVNTEIYINNNSNYLTGCGGDSASAEGIATCTNAYGSKNNGIYNQTTTGNISGIFDMSGGAAEVTTGYNTSVGTGGGNSGITSLYGDFFTNSKWNKYYDKYVNTGGVNAYNNRILGDATGELGPFASGSRSSWYDDYAGFVNSAGPWFGRGSLWNDTSRAGIFNFYNNSGGGSSFNQTFRVVAQF